MNHFVALVDVADFRIEDILQIQMETFAAPLITSKYQI